ncbi:MAG: lipopolysaccharide assembly protein LapA domain-containing protein [candidate division WOR-3 bacterium]|nr:lipopolysaccharide assembly protein LapA domain-containing protein [candidate division WOR-3 bacterium]
MRFVGLLFVIVVIGFMIGFIVLNADKKVDINMFGHQVTNLALSMVCFYSFVAGMVFVLVFALADEIILRSAMNKLKKENMNIKKELDALRNLPLEEEK